MVSCGRSWWKGDANSLELDRCCRRVGELRREIGNHDPQRSSLEGVPVRQQRRRLHVRLQLRLSGDVLKEPQHVRALILYELLLRLHDERIIQRQMYFLFYSFDNGHDFLLTGYQIG